MYEYRRYICTSLSPMLLAPNPQMAGDIVSNKGGPNNVRLVRLMPDLDKL